ncbi:hypothetical protein GALMADRAFT_158765 [Galerina marginata CBS 339.88]|uniref:F-box domain-containing protein n=1 Tax=Galerina marginata (strain CBS 339.88) TaxID=685588 RepID=A0A067SNP3_GALM3|nr:hypothetical protein GALMADRAFT_158765 [Galerina marginata CBS 339.88]
MAGASINHLPKEIHREILQVLFSISVRPTSVHTDEDIYDTPPVEWEEENARLPSLFPFNAANVCKLWYDIVTRFPKCWNRVVFDVTRDPTPFLDVFSWSKYPEKLEVLVFSSAPKFKKKVDRAREARRVAAITKVLLPEMYRCESVIFEVAYSSSLPLPNRFFEEQAPDLKKLRLECNTSIDDSERFSAAWANPTTLDEECLSENFPELVELSLTGFCFMYLALHHPNWLRQVPLGSKLDLSISSFGFLHRGFFTLPTFVQHLSQMQGPLKSLSLSKLVLLYEHEDEPRRRGAAVHRISCPRIHFNDVCEGFLSQFYSLADVTARECQSFTDCRIPVIQVHQTQHVRVLVLKEVEDPSNGPSEARGTGLRNILKVWSASELEIRSCKAFDDTLLEWLKPEVEDTECDPDDSLDQDDGSLHNGHHSSQLSGTFHSEGISSLFIRDCKNFTSRGMREFIDAHNKASEAEDENDSEDSDSEESDGERIPLRHLTVTGECPGITQEDRDYYRVTWEGLTLAWELIEEKVGGQETEKA